MAGLVDLFYPDNKNRLDRLNELTGQCDLYQQEVTTQKQNYDELIKTINENIVKILGPIQKVEMQDVKAPDGSIICQVAGGVASIFAGAGAVAAMNVAWKSWMLSQGRIGEAALVKLIGYPKWFRLARVGGAIVVAFALESIITAIEGAVQRDQLRVGIHDCIQPRINVYKAYKRNKELLKNLVAIQYLLEDLQSIGILTPEQIMTAVTARSEKAKAEMDSITDEMIENELVQMDISHKSWTKEDHILGDLVALPLSELEEAPVDYLDGSLVSAEGDDKIYLIMDGKRSLIPHDNTFNALFSTKESVHKIEKAFMESIPEGESLSESACLMKCEENGNVYFYSNAKKKLIRSIGEFNKAGFSRENILGITKEEADNIETAGDFIVAEW
jgi:hypothetical protein